MDCATTSGSGSRTGCRGGSAMLARPLKTIAASSRRCSIATAPASRGAICRSAWATGRIPIAGSLGGPKPGSGNKSSSIWRPMPTTNMRCSTAPLCGRISTASALSKKDDDQAIGRSRGGLSTKIHALVDALGNPLAFRLTAGQTHDLVGADALLPQMAADRLIADKAYDADARVLQPLAGAGKTAVIPPRSNRLAPRDFDRELYKERHLIENFFCKLKQFRDRHPLRQNRTKFPRCHPPRRRDHLAQLTTRPSKSAHMRDREVRGEIDLARLG